MNSFALIQTIAMLCAGQGARTYDPLEAIRKCHAEYLQCVRKKEAAYYKGGVIISDNSAIFLEQCIIEKKGKK